ncbi:MAG: hypothetical protein IJX46_00830 [Clostridia bacterium]|nr:hypothetical protein [Clostridia bacterium]
MHKISAPIMTSTVNVGNRDKYARLCREAGITRIFLCVNSPFLPLDPSLEDNVTFFKSEGFEVGIWTDTIGHGVALTHVADTSDTAKYQPIVNLAGVTVPYTNCPADPAFRAFIAKHIARLSATGTDIVMLDDDFRMSQHGGDELCCACEHHMARIRELTGEDISREELRPYVISGKPNRYRDAWLKAQNEGLTMMAEEIRAEVDKAHPEVTVCFCTAVSPWNADGLDIAQVTRILAGKNPPILRLTGAPYWAVKRRTYTLPGTFEQARAMAACMADEGFDLMAEGDVYPRPRYTCPASYLELFETAVRADGGYGGTLKYMFDYVAGPDFETGYLQLHREDMPFYERLAEFFPKGANAGVKIVFRPHTMKNADLDLSDIKPQSPRPSDGAIISSCGIPTVYRGEGVCNSVFGENAREYDLSELSRGTILDSVAAVILTERGVDVGLESYGRHEQKKITYLCTDDPEFRSYITKGQSKMLKATLKPSAEPLIYSAEPSGNIPFAYRYENEKGERFFVFLFDGDSTFTSVEIAISGLIVNHVTQDVLINNLPWVARRPLPAVCNGNPELYLLCEKGEDYMSVALMNCFADRLTNPVIVLDESYSRIECLGCEAELCGNRVRLTSRLSGFESAAFRVFK